MGSGDQNQLFGIVNFILGSGRQIVYPQHTDSLALASLFNNYFITKIADIRKEFPGLELDAAQMSTPDFNVQNSHATLSDFTPTTNDEVQQLLSRINKTTCKLRSLLYCYQFSSVFSTPSTDEKVTDPDSFFTYNIDGKPLLTDIIIDDEHIVFAVKEMSVSSSAGPDGLPSSFLKNCLQVLIKPLKILFRKSLDSGDIPAIFKRAAIVPIFKGGDRTCPANYRPISLTPVLMKLFERIIRKQVISFLVVNKLLNLSQHGFRENRSCLSALLDVYDILLFMLAENPCIIDMIYLDFYKAFDKVDFGILFHKMKDMGITGKLGIWFYHFLVNRTQFVRLPGGSSTDIHVISGVPQGTVLGPLLFLILMSDIDEGIVNSKIISFADDTRLYNSVSEVEDCDVLQSDLNTIYKWADANNMVLFRSFPRPKIFVIFIFSI